MLVLKNKMFFKWAKAENLSDELLLSATNEIELGLIDARLGSYLI